MQFKTFVALSISSFIFCGCQSVVSESDFSSSERPQPNILFVAFDDMRPSLGVYGDNIAITPNLDAFATNATLFERAYVQQATCSPSRASLMSGLRPDQLRIYYSNATTKLVEDHVPLDETLNGFFKSNGYETIGIGKIYHKNKDSVGGWSAPYFDHSQSKSLRTTKGAVTQYALDKAREWSEQRPKGQARPFPYEAGDVDDNGYSDGINTQHAISELKRLSNSNEPFFMALGFKKPHLPFFAPKPYWDAYDRDLFQIPTRRAPPIDAPEFTIANSGELRRYAFMPQGKTRFPDETTISLTHGYYATISYVDAQFGKLMAALYEAGLSENTIVVIWGDHGYKLGEYGAFNKHTNMEIDTNVPLIVRLPGQTTSARTKAFVEAIDLFPTFADLAGLNAPSGIDGRSFAKILATPSASFRDAAIHQFPRKVKNQNAMGYAVRSEDYRYVVWMDRQTRTVLATELYDHKLDPKETKNLAALPQYEDVMEEHFAHLAKEYPLSMQIEP